MQEEILKKTGWSEKQLGYYGSVIFNVVDVNNQAIADIVSRRDEKQISVDWFMPDKKGQKISLVYDTESLSLNKDKTDTGIQTDEDIGAFLRTVHNTIKDSKAQFFPSKKIVAEVTKKITI